MVEDDDDVAVVEFQRERRAGLVVQQADSIYMNRTRDVDGPEAAHPTTVAVRANVAAPP